MAEQKKAKKLEEAVEIPAGVEVACSDETILIKSKAGSVEKTFSSPFASIKKIDGRLVVSSPSSTRNYKRVFYTFKSHIKNMLEGAQNGFEYKLKICSGHFPMTVKVEGRQLVISNFLGEKIPRRAKILPQVAVKIDKDIILVTSPDLEAAGQTAGNIEKSTSVGARDRRVFQDGCYIIKKPGRSFI